MNRLRSYSDLPTSSNFNYDCPLINQYQDEFESMAKKPMSEYTVEELQAKVQILSNFRNVLIGIYAFLLITMLVYGWMRNWEVEMKVPLIVICVGGATTLLGLLTSHSSFVNELKNREAN